ncbi:NDP-hexose 2,3-dehydratase family protein [Streptomyces sparsogenes]|uniref:NDP-hexose 2,3-dehydratase family protein n=1 Tax=Streptomyces sparsogenes TaxID=67365 RepID=UPI00384D4C40
MSDTISVRPRTTPREDAALAGRIARSAAALQGQVRDADDVLAWLERREREIHFAVDRIKLDELDGWSFQEDTGNLAHRSGRFFTVEGLRVAVEHEDGAHVPVDAWQQPVICQLEVGILGILAREIDGVLHFLMQAKMEPGNSNLLQLSPTVQATRSNYTKVHQSSAVRYLEYLRDLSGARVLSDVLQSEHGSWFFRKRNRNMIVEVDGPVEEHADFRWLTLGQIARLLHRDNVVNMDARSVLAGLPGGPAPRALFSDAEVLSWLADARSQSPVRADRVPLASVPGWVRDEAEGTVRHEEGRYFRVVGVSVEAGSREVSHWTQPILEPCGQGLAAFLTREIDGVTHVLASAKAEGGFREAELGPTVQVTLGNYAHLPADRQPPFLDLVRDPDPARVRYSALHDEEGGRFLNTVSRYLLVEADESQAPLAPPPGFRWVSHAQLAALALHSHYVTVQARTLLTCLNAASAGSGWGGAPLTP